MRGARRACGAQRGDELKRERLGEAGGAAVAPQLRVDAHERLRLEQPVVRARDVEEGDSLASDGAHPVGALHVGGQRGDARRDVLHALPDLLEVPVHVPHRAQRVVGRQKDLGAVGEHRLRGRGADASWTCLLAARGRPPPRTCGSAVRRGEVLPVTVDSIWASPAATTPALKSTCGKGCEEGRGKEPEQRHACQERPPPLA